MQAQEVAPNSLSDKKLAENMQFLKRGTKKLTVAARQEYHDTAAKDQTIWLQKRLREDQLMNMIKLAKLEMQMAECIESEDEEETFVQRSQVSVSRSRIYICWM